MCRNTLSVGWRGELRLRLQPTTGYAVEGTKPLYLWDVDPDRLHGRTIAVGNHCYGCTAGHGYPAVERWCAKPVRFEKPDGVDGLPCVALW